MYRRGGGRFLGRKPKLGGSKDDKIKQESVHRRNFRIVAFPVIFLFEVIRFLAFQFWLLISFACESAHSVSQSRKQSQAEGAKDIDKTPSDDSDVFEIEDQAVLLPPMSMSLDMPQTLPNPGPGEPALAKQKHHHRKAFEYISKALKLDEDDRGNTS